MKNVIFDLGAVMFNWNPRAIAENFTDNEELQERIQSQLYYHQDWIDFDNHGSRSDKPCKQKA